MLKLWWRKLFHRREEVPDDLKDAPDAYAGPITLSDLRRAARTLDRINKKRDKKRQKARAIKKPNPTRTKKKK